MTTNVLQVTARIAKKINGLSDGGEYSDKMLREIAISLDGTVHKRIHESGLNAKGLPIGTYKPSYMRVRESSKYNRTSSTKVILSLTKQMETDFGVIDVAGNIGLGFKNSIDYDKAIWNEERFGNIYGLTDSETKDMDKVISAYLKKLFG